MLAEIHAEVETKPQGQYLLLCAANRASENMVRGCRYGVAEAILLVSFATVSSAFRSGVRLRHETRQSLHVTADANALLRRSTSSVTRRRYLIPSLLHSGMCTTPQSLSSHSSARNRAFDIRDGDNSGGRLSSVVMMARASNLRAEQKRRANAAEPVILSAKQKRQASRDRREFFREKFARSGRRLIKLQQEDEDSFYVGFVGTNRAGRAQALKAVETFLKRATELKVAKYYKGNADVKLLDVGNLRISEMAGNNEHKLGLLRRCDLLVHVVRCFDLHKPKPYTPRGVDVTRDGGTLNDDQRQDEEVEASKTSSNLGGIAREIGEDDIEWPLSPTPLEDVKSARGDMAVADLRFIEERQRSNHTKWFWRDRRRAFNERNALELVSPVLEDIYAAGGDLNPIGLGFRESCLADARNENGTTVYRSRLRSAIHEIGFLSPKPVVYVANIPIEAAPQAIDEDSGGDIDQEVTAEAAESAEAIARLALAHAQSVVDMGRDYNVPAVAACLQVRDGQEDLGAAVFKAIPSSFLSRDPKLKKATKSKAKKGTQAPPLAFVPKKRPGASRARVKVPDAENVPAADAVVAA